MGRPIKARGSGAFETLRAENVRLTRLNNRLLQETTDLRAALAGAQARMKLLEAHSVITHEPLADDKPVESFISSAEPPAHRVFHRPVTVPPVMQRMWLEHGGGALEPLLRRGCVALVDASWLAGQAQRHPDTAIKRRQDLPDEAFIGVDELKAAGCPWGSLPIAVVSAPWLDPDQPDPKAVTLGLVGRACRALTLNGQRWGIFWGATSARSRAHPEPLT